MESRVRKLLGGNIISRTSQKYFNKQSLESPKHHVEVYQQMHGKYESDMLHLQKTSQKSNQPLEDISVKPTSTIHSPDCLLVPTGAFEFLIDI